MARKCRARRAPRSGHPAVKKVLALTCEEWGWRGASATALASAAGRPGYVNSVLRPTRGAKRHLPRSANVRAEPDRETCSTRDALP